MTTAREINGALYAHFTGRYAVLTELVHETDQAVAYREQRRDANAHLAPGKPYPDLDYPAAWERRVDVLLVSKTERIAVEVKVSRADFLADVRDPAKQATWKALAHRHAWACPHGLIRPDEVPVDSGLIYVGESRGESSWPSLRKVEWVKRAPKGNAPPDLPPRVLWTIINRCARAEAHAKGLLAAAEDDPGALRLALERAQRDLDLEINRRVKAVAAAAAWRAALAVHGDAPCAACGGPLRPEWGRRNGFAWKHRDPLVEQACHDARVAADAATGATYPHAGPVEPADVAALVDDVRGGAA